MSTFLYYDIARQITTDRVNDSATSREVRRARRARRRSRAPVGVVIELPVSRPGSWLVERAAS